VDGSVSGHPSVSMATWKGEQLNKLAEARSSVPALVAWRLGQLYTVLPKRATEAERWMRLGSRLWPFGTAEQGGVAIESLLGGPAAWSGDGEAERPFVASLLMNRLFLSQIL
jgi:hypothetical protein